MGQKKRKHKQKFDWRAVPDGILLSSAPRWSSLPSPASLRPDASLMDRVVQGDPVAEAIVMTWQFRFPVAVRHA